MIRSSRSDDEYNNNNSIQRPRRVQRLSSTNSTNSASTQQITYKNSRQQQQSQQHYCQNQQQQPMLIHGAVSGRNPQQTVFNGSNIIRAMIMLLICIAIPIFVVFRKDVSNKYYDVTHTSSSSVRVFGPTTDVSSSKWPGEDHRLSYALYSRHDQRRFLESDDGGYACQKAIMKNNNHYYQKLIEQQQDTAPTYEDTPNHKARLNLLVQRFDQLPLSYGTELWKYCVLYTGIHNVYWDMENLVSMQSIDDILVGPISDLGSKTQGAVGARDSKRKFSTAYTTENVVIRVDGALAPSRQRQSITDQDDTATVDNSRLHHSFLKLSTPNSKVALGMMLYILDYDGSTSTTAMVPLDTISLQQTLSMLVTNDQVKKRSGTWNFWTAKCNEPPFLVGSSTYEQFNRVTNHMVDVPCLAEAGEPCCQVWTSTTTIETKSVAEAISSNPPALLLHHSNIVSTHPQQASTSGIVSSRLSTNPLPLTLQNKRPEDLTDENIGMSKAHLPFIATVREYRTNVTPATIQETPNYFDILLHNNCLPHDKECFKCLQSGYKIDGGEGGDCTVCHDKCPCYCDALCNVRPPPKRLAAEWVVTTPRYRKNPERLVPRIIHQTWFESVTKEKYPNMSRLIESFRKSGWEYEFYDDDKAAQFLSVHFPPAVREAYDSLIPGAFKADLFRYCVLLIRGGLYADMDILLESNLDESVPPDVGFLTPQDSPGETIGHRSCLWNGLMAVAPGHPVLAQTIQNVVNNVRNRFTSVDYDDMLCPNPVLSVSHTVDTLFTCGPCIIGASLNDVLKRHRQDGFDYGEIDIFATEKQIIATQRHRRASDHYLSLVEPNDPRWLIPGKIVLLKQNKGDMGSHRFTMTNENLIVAATDMPEYDDRPKSIEHYSKSHARFGVYGLTKLYTNQNRANEEIRIRIDGTPLLDKPI